ncbi:MAG TPA: L-threonylcarbamoyladenylate synthase [Deltaproteobacteria bacterium]|nr:L-threonylcarbamoyladenylate synthase [Deltaproteobacteria bacterium]HQI81965.1 L-threonylcarbamoyladenylate synthase [Deltaproteobacteria bacterium]
MLVTSDVTAVARLLLSRPGCVCAYPTETFYGLGSRIDDAAALNRIIVAKGRDALKGMIVLVTDMAMAAGLAVMDDRQKAFLARLWPAPVSAVLQAARALDPLLAPDGRVALRVSPHRMATELVQQVGPVTSTSANRTGEPPARTAGEAAGQDLDIDAILDGGRTPGGKPSTLVDLTVWPPVCLREGAVPFQEILDLSF